MRLAALLALTAVAGCNDVTGPAIRSAPAPIVATIPIALTTGVSSATLPRGDSVTITITLRNMADTKVTVHLHGCSPPYVVSTPFGQVVGPDVAELVCPAMLILRTLTPHESVSIPQTWDGMLVPDVQGQRRVSPGDYLVRGSGIYGPVRRNPPVPLNILL